jgi:hypothetical protein
MQCAAGKSRTNFGNGLDISNPAAQCPARIPPFQKNQARRLNMENKSNIKLLEEIDEFNHYVKNITYLNIPYNLFRKDIDGLKLKILALMTMYTTSTYYLSDKDFSEMFGVEIKRVEDALEELKNEKLIEIGYIDLGIVKVRYIKRTLKFLEYVYGEGK